MLVVAVMGALAAAGYFTFYIQTPSAFELSSEASLGEKDLSALATRSSNAVPKENTDVKNSRVKNKPPKVSDTRPAEDVFEMLTIISNERQFIVDSNKLVDQFSADEISEKNLNDFIERLLLQEAGAVATLIEINSNCIKSHASTASCGRMPSLEREEKNNFINYAPFQALEELALAGNLTAQLSYWNALSTVQRDGLIKTVAYPHEWQWRKTQAFSWLEKFSRQGSYYASSELASAYFYDHLVPENMSLAAFYAIQAEYIKPGNIVSSYILDTIREEGSVDLKQIREQHSKHF